MNGRCQGFYCAAAVSRLFAESRRAGTVTCAGAGNRQPDIRAPHH